MKTRHRAYAYVTHGCRLLIFTHPQSPEAGIQVPAGTITEGEDPAIAALREAREETGLSTLRLVSFLGQDTRDMRDCGSDELQYRWFYHLACDGTPPEKWSHGEFDDAGRLVHPFDFSWAELPNGVPDLVANYGDMIPELMESLHRGRSIASARSGSPVSEIVATKRAVIFDLFHTLTALESTWGDDRPVTHVMLGVEKVAWDRQLHEQSRQRLIGEEKDAFTIVANMARAIDPSIADERVRQATENRIARFAAALVQIPTRTQEVIRSLRKSGKRIGLISNADVMEVAAWPECPIRDLFDSTIFSCQVGCVKPEEKIYRCCLEQLGVTASETVFVGDGGSNELEGAKALGMTTIMVAGIIREIWPDRIAQRQQHADFLIEELSELLSLAEQEGLGQRIAPVPGNICEP